MATRLIVLGATGSLGTHVVRQALEAGHDVSVVVRDPSGLPADLVSQLSVHTADLRDPLPVTVIREQDALINCAGHVADGLGFVDLVDSLIGSIEAVTEAERPVCWFLAGAALLEMDEAGRRGVDLPEISPTYWPHLVNYERLLRSHLDWRLLCPGPMVEGPALGLDRLCLSLDHLPVEAGCLAQGLPDALMLAEFGKLIPQITVPYADAAALMLANLERGSRMSRHRVGLAVRTHDAIVASVHSQAGASSNEQ
jgi:putative NADH-flavin reductase